MTARIMGIESRVRAESAVTAERFARLEMRVNRMARALSDLLDERERTEYATDGEE